MKVSIIREEEEENAKTNHGNTGNFAVNSGLSSVIFDNSQWLKTNETAEYLRTSPKQIRNWVYQGRLKAYKLMGRSLRFRKSELDLLFEGGPKWE
jgi:excisionase family DNA binding protein